MFTVEVYYDTVLFKHLCNGAFLSGKLRKHMRNEGHLFFQNVQNFM